MNKSPKVTGERTEALILAKLVTAGYAVSLPFGNNQRYDLIYEDAGVLKKAQCKTGRLRNGAVSFEVASKNSFTGVRTDYEGQVDEFLVYCPDNDSYYRIPAKQLPTTVCALRVDEPKNNQTSHIRFAADYAI